jgi:hypothetical protein
MKNFVVILSGILVAANGFAASITGDIVQSDLIACKFNTDANKNPIVAIYTVDNYGKEKRVKNIKFDDYATRDKALDLCKELTTRFEVRDFARMGGGYMRALFDTQNYTVVAHYWFDLDAWFDLPDPSLESLRIQTAAIVSKILRNP